MSSDNELSASKLYEEAYDLMLNDQYDQALEAYSLAIEKCDKTDKSTVYNYYIGRAQAYLKLNKSEEAVKDAELALELNPDDSRAYLKKGTAFFNLKKYADALPVLEQGAKIAEELKEKKQNLFTDLIAKCKKEIPAPKPEVKTDENEEKAQAQAAASASAPVPVQPQVRYDWYQTESSVTVCILVKNLRPEDLKIEAQEHTLSVVSVDQEKHKINFNFNLANSIAFNDTHTNFLSSKVEIKLKKAEAGHWSALELNAQQLAARKAQQEQKPTYPSSSKKPKNWDKIVADVVNEEKDEKLEGDAALNKLFQQIYANGTDETRRAMNKSFSESGGTVLSTNWKEVGEKKIDIQAPDGLEFKKWDK